MSRQPANFSWVSENVAGFAFPYTKDELNYLANEAKLSHIITMCHEKPDYLSDYSSINHHYFPVDDLTPARLDLIQEAMKVIQQAESQNEKVGVHCQLGRGRAGTILACYLAYKHNWDGIKAVEELRRLRPKSVDSDQLQAVKAYAKSIQK